jgi:parvulin-like peptidyl-prolyl isomerase
VRAITFGAIGVITIVILLVVYGILNQTVIQARQPIVEIGDTTVRTREFQARVRLARQQLINQYLQNYQFALMFGVDPTTDEYFSSALNEIATKLSSPALVGSDTITQIVDEILIRQEAEKLGITVSEAEIDEAIRADFNFFPNGTPTATTTLTPVVTSTLSATQRALVTLTPTSLPQPTSTPLPTPTLDPNATAAPTATPTTVPPTATPYTLEGFQESYQTNLDNFDEIGMTEAEYRRIYENQLLRKKVMDAITADVSQSEEQVWARHILVSDEATATLIRAMLDEGDDFAVLAAEYSTDTSNNTLGGDLGWFGRGKMVAEFEAVAFSLEIGEISQPIQTSFGYHIIQVLGHEERPLSTQVYQSLREQKFQEWLDSLREVVEITIHEYWTERVPDQPDLATEFNKYFGQQTSP